MSIDPLARRLATLANTNSAAALNQVVTANTRIASIPLFSSFATATISDTVNAVMTSGYVSAGIGGGLYVSDSLATTSTATNYPKLCNLSADGRYWRLVSASGAISLEQLGAIANDSTAGVVNVQAWTQAVAYLTAFYGGGIINCGAGTFTFDRATMGNSGLFMASRITLRGVRGATIWVTNDAAPVFNSSPSYPLLSVTGSDMAIEDLELRGYVACNNVQRGALRRCKVTGFLTSETQYTDTGLALASYFGGSGQSYSDGTLKSGSTDLVVSSTAQSDTSFTLASGVMSIAMTAQTAALGSQRYMRYVLSDFIPLDPAKFYVAAFDSGFLTGAGGTRPMFLLYDANKNPITSGDGRAVPTNLYEPQQAFQWGTTSAMISGASYMRVALGAARDFSTPLGLTAAWNLSKVRLYALANDFVVWANAIKALVPSNSFVSPGNLGQVGIFSCTDFVVDDCDFAMIARSAIVMGSSTNVLVNRCRFRFVMQGIIDNSGYNNRIMGNSIDLRMRNNAGTLIGSRAFRLRGISGQSGDKVVIDGNTIIGASWGIEMLLQSLSRTAVVQNNTVDAEFAGISVARADWVCRANKISLASDAILGIECPGGDDGTGLGNGLQRALVESNDIRWNEFSGFAGCGISATEAQQVIIKGGYIRAPIIAQNLGPVTNGVLHIDGTDGEYSVSAIFGAAGPVYAHFGRLIPNSTQQVVQYTGWTSNNPYSGIFDIRTSDTSRPISVGADHVEVGMGPLANLANSSNLSLNFPEIYTPSANYPDRYVRILPTSGADTLVTMKLNYVGIPSGAGAYRCSAIFGTLGTNSRISMIGCTVGSERLRAPDGSYSRGLLRGDLAMASYALSNQAIGTLAAGGVWTATTTVIGASVGDGPYLVLSNVPGGLSGLIAQAWPTADDTVSVQITNPGTSSRAVATQSLIIMGRKIY